MLFVAMRLLAILLFRPGGFFADNSDYDFYMLWGEMIPSGYTTFQDMWTAYPPLFPALMLPVFELAARIPPWVEPDLAFHVLLGGLLLLFEAGNLILIYRLGNRLAEDDTSRDDTSRRYPPRGGTHLAEVGAQPGLLPAVLYALLFAPIYTLLGWFEAMPLFFMLLGLDLLLRPRWGWLGSAIAAALGFLVKLTPVLLIPIAVRWLGARLSLDAARHEWFQRTSPGNLLRPALYVLTFAAVTAGVGWVALGPNFDPALVTSSLRVNAIRPPWQSLWALLDGFYGYGLVPIDMRNLQGLARGDQWQTRLPWGLIGLAFIALYTWLYTRRYDWSRARTPIAFAAVSVVWLFLYSKGWSPQFVVWILAFLVLLNLSLHGMLLATMLTAINFVESTVFLLLLPNEHWLLVGTVSVRTLLLLLIAAEWLGQIWPAAATGARVQQWAARGAWAVMAVALTASLVGAPVAAQAYWDRRSAEHPCAEAITLLQAEAGGAQATIVTPQIEVWRNLYPWLRQEYTIHVLDGYDPNDRPAVEVMGEKLATIAAAGEFWWVEETQAGTSAVLERFELLEERTLGQCRLVRVLKLPAEAAIATFDTAGSPISLLDAAIGEVQDGQLLPLVLYWQAGGQVDAGYTVFTQLFDASGALVAQQDNLPVQGLAPTDTWRLGVVVRDPYRLALPAGIAPGAYTLHVGLYDATGQRAAAIGETEAADDHIVLPVTVQ